MKNKLLIVCVLQFVFVNAQDDALVSQISHNNGLVYFNNKPLSGTLFSDDATEIPNSCLCTLKASYTHGKLNGLKEEWYNTGSQKYSGQFNDGNKTGMHKTFYQNGNQKTTETYQFNQQTKYIEYFQNGNIAIDKTYSNNKKEGVHKVFFKNGKPHTLKTYKNDKIKHNITYYSSGEIHIEKNYLNNKKHGLHKEFNEDGSLLLKEEFNNDALIKKERFNKNTKITHVYNNTIEEVTTSIFDVKQKVEYYNITSKSKEGIWLIFNEKGNKTSENVYQDDKKIRTGNYLNNLKNGEWHYYAIDGKTETIKTFLNDKETTSKTIVFANLISHNLPKKNETLVFYKDGFDGSIKYYILKFERTNTNNDFIEKIKIGLKTLLKTRAYQVFDIKSIENKELSGIIKINNINVKFKESIYERTRTTNGKLVTYNETGYDAFINYTIQAFNMAGETHFNHTFKINKTSKLLNSLFNNAVSSYAKTKKNAFKRSYKHLTLQKLIVTYFPVKGHLKEIIKGNKKTISKIKISCGSNNNVKNKMNFYVFDEVSQKYYAKLQVVEVFSDTAICKVITEKKWLKQYLATHSNCLVEESN